MGDGSRDVGEGALRLLCLYKLRAAALNSLRCSCGRTAVGFLPEASIILGQPFPRGGTFTVRPIPVGRCVRVHFEALGSIQPPNRLHYAAVHSSSLQQKHHEAA